MAAPTSTSSGRDSIQGLKKGDLTELKSLASPPPDVVVVLTAVAVLLGQPRKTVTWATIKKLLADMNLLKTLSGLDVGKVPPAVAREAGGLLQDLSKERIANCSRACASFYVWAKYIIEEVEKNAGNDAGDGLSQATNT